MITFHVVKLNGIGQTELGAPYLIRDNAHGSAAFWRAQGFPVNSVVKVTLKNPPLRMPRPQDERGWVPQ